MGLVSGMLINGSHVDYRRLRGSLKEYRTDPLLPSKS